MKTIEIDDDLFATLEANVRGFNETPNAVLKRLLAQIPNGGQDVNRQLSEPPSNPFGTLLTSPGYLRGNAEARYFQILAAILQQQGDQKFAHLEMYSTGRRVHFARDPETIEQSGKSTKPKPIPGTPYYALSNLSNPTKRKILSDILRMFAYPQTVASAVLATIPDFGIRKRINLDAYANL